MTLTIKDCKATPTHITVVFSEPVKADSKTVMGSATNPKAYDIVPIPPPAGQKLFPLNGAAAIYYDSARNTVRITPFFDPQAAAPDPWPWSFVSEGSWIGVRVSNVMAENGAGGIGADGEVFPALVNDHEEERDIRRIARVTEDSFAFPQLSEEVGFAPSPLARPPGAPSGGGTAALGQMVTQAVSDVLGWKIKPDDSKGFVGALNASFTCNDVNGHNECKWTPRTYAVQTDLSGGITGAQASLYSRAQDALNQSLPLLDGLYPLDPEADAEDVAALKGVARSQLTEMVNELGMAGGPRVSRVNQYFQLLLQNPDEESFPPSSGASLITDPDQIHGTLGKLRDQLGLNFTFQDFANTVQDEQDITNFRILSDYVTSLAQSWLNNLGFFGLDTSTPFFGTQLVLLSRQLSVVAEAVDEVRFTLDSVFIGPAERQTLELQFPGVSKDSMFAEDLFNWIQSFATDEGPRLIQDGGKFGVKFSFLPIAQKLQRLVESIHDPDPLDHAFRTIRVKRALGQLGRELNELIKLAKDVSHVIEEQPTKADFDAIRQQLALLTFDVKGLEGGQLPPPPVSPTLIAIPPQLSFAQPQLVDADSLPQIFTLFNISTVRLNINSIVPSTSDFKLIDPSTFPVTLAPQGTLAVAVSFTPTSAGDLSANLSVGGDASLVIPLKGTGQPKK
jgi:hypothetical protein